MQTKRTKLTAILMSILMLSGAFAGCGEKGTADSDETKGAAAPAAENVPEETEEETKDHLDNLGEYDFGGNMFNILTRESKVENIVSEESTGEAFNDAVFYRNQKISERFNVEIGYKALKDDGATWNQQLGASVMAEDGAYDIVLPDYWWGCETGGFFLDMLAYNSIMDFSQPWWCAGWNNSSEIFGQMYSAVGSLCIDLYANAICTFFNKQVLTELSLESPYELVDSGKWTMDKMLEMSATNSSDLNGDGKMLFNDDKFGSFYDLQSGRALFASFGWKTATKTDDGKYAYEFWDDNFIKLYEDVLNIIKNTDSVSYNGGDGGKAFKENRLLFLNTGMGVASQLREMESDFGIVPYPKYNENQENYITYNFGTYYIAILKTALNPEMSAVIAEALNAESYNTVKNAYYEINMKNKFSRDPETVRMLDIIVDTTYFDFTFVNESATAHIVMYFFDQVAANNSGIASAYKKQQKVFEKSLSKLFEKYSEMAGGN